MFILEMKGISETFILHSRLATADAEALDETPSLAEEPLSAEESLHALKARLDGIQVRACIPAAHPAHLSMSHVDIAHRIPATSQAKYVDSLSRASEGQKPATPSRRRSSAPP